jgi:hypothetical protein
MRMEAAAAINSGRQYGTDRYNIGYATAEKNPTTTAPAVVME